MDHIEFTMTTSEVAKLFGVANQTVTNWAKVGKLPAFKTIGGHYRYFEEDVYRLYNAIQERGSHESDRC